MVNRNISVSVYELSSKSVTGVDLGSPLEPLRTLGLFWDRDDLSSMVWQGKISWELCAWHRVGVPFRSLPRLLPQYFLRTRVCTVLYATVSASSAKQQLKGGLIYFFWACQVQAPDQCLMSCHERMEGSVT